MASGEELYLQEEIRMTPEYTSLVRSVLERKPGEAVADSKPRIRKNTQSTTEYLKKMALSSNNNAGVLPPNCRFVEQLNNGGHLVVIEEPPAYRTITVNSTFEREIETLQQDGKLEEWGINGSFYKSYDNAPFKFTLAFPYVIFILMFDSHNSLMTGSVFLRTARMGGYSDYLLKMPMMNISSGQSICFGDKARGSFESLNAAVENTIMVFWSATFNQDYTYNYNAYKNTAGVDTYIGWEKLSQQDPMFIYSVQWIRMEQNVYDTIQYMKNKYKVTTKGQYGYQDLSQLFTRPQDTGKEESVFKGSRRKQRLYYDISQGIYLKDQFFIHVGDRFRWNNHNAYIDSFIGFYETDAIRYVRVQTEHGKRFLVKFTSKFSNFLYNEIKKARFEEEATLTNGDIIKENDIVILKGIHDNDMYKKVYYIRKARDGMTEVRLGNSFYILENIEASKFNPDTPKFNGEEISKDTPYFLVKSMNQSPMHVGHEVRFDSLDVNDRGNLFYKFISLDPDMDNYAYNIDTTKSTEKSILVNPSEARPLCPVFRVGRKLYIKRESVRKSRPMVWATPDGIIHDGNYNTNNPTITEIAKHVLNEDGTHMHVESFDMDIDFHVGEKVVCADWQNPINMLIIKTITGFKVDRNAKTISFILTDKDGNLSEQLYITGTNDRDSNAVILVGKVRKITNHYERLTAGTKIQATKGYIPHFPKKDVNIIIGFITDTGGSDPLVLCSNCCTLWYSDIMENFKRTTMKSKKWASMEHAPIDLSKIKVQPGDIINGLTDYRTNCGWLVVQNPSYKSVRISSLENYTNSYNDDYTYDVYTRNHTLLDCIPSPRVSPAKQSKMEMGSGWTNFHNLVIENKFSRFTFPKYERSFLHVQSTRS